MCPGYQEVVFFLLLLLPTNFIVIHLLRGRAVSFVFAALDSLLAERGGKVSPGWQNEY